MGDEWGMVSNEIDYILWYYCMKRMTSAKSVGLFHDTILFDRKGACFSKE